MRQTLVFIALLTCLTGSPAALAEPPSAALRLYAAGEFVAAADMADARSSSSSRAFASRALVAACAAAQSPEMIDALLVRAESSAREALALDPNSVDARLQLALVYGMEGRRASIVHAFAAGFAARGKRLIDEALAVDPDNAHAHALLGAWNLEVVRRGGAMGSALYGARISIGIAEFERAAASAPTDMLIPLHFAVALLGLDPVQYAARAHDLLTKVAMAPSADALGQIGRETALQLLNAAHESPQAAQRAARASIL